MKIGIIIGSVREGRIGSEIANWVLEQTEQRDVTYELIDLKAFDLPILSSTRVPASVTDGSYDDERVRAFSEVVSACDGFLFVTAEYNHSIPGAFKNAFDSLFNEWWNKAVAFVSYGAALGFRAVEQWRPIVANANMFDIKAQLAFSIIQHVADGKVVANDRHVIEANGMFDSLEAAAGALSTLRA